MHRLPFLLRLCFLLLCCSSVQAQVSVTAGLSQNQVTLGEQVQLSLQVRGTTRPPQVPEITVPGLDIQNAGASQSTQIDGNTGQIQMSVNYGFLINAQQAGEFDIPAIELNIDNQIYKTQPLHLKVLDAGAPGSAPPDQFSPIIKIETSKNEFYESEVVQLTVTLLLHRSTNLQEQPNINVTKDNFAMKRLQGSRDQRLQNINGVQYQAIIFVTSVNAIKSGDLVLGPADAKLNMLVPDGTGRRDPFGMMNGKAKNYKIVSNVLNLKVKPLPEAGKPANFSGAVGKFTTQIQAQPNKVMEGDPIAATLYINGVGNFESLDAPSMTPTDGWRQYPAKLVQENRNVGLEQGQVVYSQVLIPDKVQTQLPAFFLTFFNPETATYETARTDALPLQVVPNPAKANATNATAGPTTTGIRDFSFEGKDTPKEDLQGVLSVLRSPGTMLSLTSPSMSLRYPWIVHGVGGLGLAALAFVVGKRRLVAQARVRAAQAADAPIKAAELLRQVKAEQSSLQKFYRLAADYLTAWQREGNRPWPTDEARVQAAQQIRLKRDFYNFGSAEAAAQPVPPAEFQEVLATLQKF